MNMFKRFFVATSETLQISGRARVLSQLRQMDEDFLRDYGFSPAKIDQGVAAWPWRLDEEATTETNVVAHMPTKAKAAEAELPRAA